MPEIHHLEQRNQTGKDGYGKGAQLRRGANLPAFRSNWDSVFGKKTEDAVADCSDASGSVPADGR